MVTLEQSLSISNFNEAIFRDNKSQLEFYQTIKQLDIERVNFSGDILLAGIGHNCPEKILACTPESDFRNLKPQISGLVCCDYGFNNNPTRHFNNQVIKYTDKKPRQLNSQQVPFYPRDIIHVSKLFPNQFDIITFFRIPLLYINLTQKLTAIHSSLKKGGYLIGSGDLNDSDKLKIPGFNIIQAGKIKDFSQLPYQQGHTGFILEKTI